MDTCRWTANMDLIREYDYWETDCGKAFVINDGTPEENDMRFCCYCGGRLEQVMVNHAPEGEEEESE